jgi:TonB family protein
MLTTIDVHRSALRSHLREKMPIRVLFFGFLLLTSSFAAIADEKETNGLESKAVADFNTCPKPLWPRESVRLEQTGTVRFAFLILQDGQVGDTLVIKSSGHELLDQATLEAVKKCIFKPAIKGGKPEPAWMQMSYVWTFE